MSELWAVVWFDEDGTVRVFGPFGSEADGDVAADGIGLDRGGETLVTAMLDRLNGGSESGDDR